MLKITISYNLVPNNACTVLKCLCYLDSVYGKTSTAENFLTVFVVFTRPWIFSHELWPCWSAIQVYRTATAKVLPWIYSYFSLKTWKYSPMDVFPYTVSILWENYGWLEMKVKMTLDPQFLIALFNSFSKK